MKERTSPCHVETFSELCCVSGWMGNLIASKRREKGDRSGHMWRAGLSCFLLSSEQQTTNGQSQMADQMSNGRERSTEKRNERRENETLYRLPSGQLRHLVVEILDGPQHALVLAVELCAVFEVCSDFREVKVGESLGVRLDLVFHHGAFGGEEDGRNVVKGSEHRNDTEDKHGERHVDRDAVVHEPVEHTLLWVSGWNGESVESDRQE